MNCLISLKEIAAPERHLGYLDTSYRRLFGSLDVSPVLSFDRRQFMMDIAPSHAKRMSISGVQQKLSLKIEDNQLVPTETEGRYILKPSPEQYPEASENEHLSMLIGQLLGIETPPCGLIQFSDGERAYVIKRFDRINGEKVHQLDMTAAFGLQRDEQGEYRYAQSYEDASKKIHEITGGKLVAVRDVFYRVLHAFLIGNGDHHLKNISVQMRSRNRDGICDGLTPQYDSLNTKLYLPHETDFALDFLTNGEFTEDFEKLGFFTKSDFNELARRIGLTEKVVASLYGTIEKKHPDMVRLIDASYLSEPMKAKYKDIVAERYKMLFETASPTGATGVREKT